MNLKNKRKVGSYGGRLCALSMLAGISLFAVGSEEAKAKLGGGPFRTTLSITVGGNKSNSTGGNKTSTSSGSNGLTLISPSSGSNDKVNSGPKSMLGIIPGGGGNSTLPVDDWTNPSGGGKTTSPSLHLPSSENPRSLSNEGGSFSGSPLANGTSGNRPSPLGGGSGPNGMLHIS